MISEKIEAYSLRLESLRKAEEDIQEKCRQLYKEMDADGIQCLLCANYVALPKRYCPYRNSDLKDFPKCFVEKETE